MIIIKHPLDQFLYNLFPNAAAGDSNSLIAALENYYAFGPFKPTIKINDSEAIITLDIATLSPQKADFDRCIKLCEKGQFNAAKPILQNLIRQNPTVSEFHRILGQVYSEQGNQDEAINSLIDALKWDPKNGYALLMMGNIFARYKNDIDTALSYYNQALKINPGENIAINNIGANLLQLGKTKEAIEYLEKAYALNANYPNTSYGLSMAWDIEGYPLAAFDYAIKCMKASGKPNDGMYKSAHESAIKFANELCKEETGLKTFNIFKSYLEIKTGLEIKVEKDGSIPTAAKIEFAENYERDYHLVKYKPGFPAVEHLMMHELVHLEFATEAREEKKNQLFISGKDMKIRFIRDSEKELQKLQREGYSEEVISNFINALYEGINRQIFNTPIDLFIEDYIFENYEELRPYQFLSLNRLINEGKKAVTDQTAIKLTPRLVFTASKVLNLVNAIQYKDLYGIDLLPQFKALPMEMKEAERIWTEFLEYRKDRKPGEEYELVSHWAEDLRLENYSELVDEIDFRNKPNTIEEVIKLLEEDPFGSEVDKNLKEREGEIFLKNQEEIGTNMAVVMFMVDALKRFDEWPLKKIKDTALEIAMVGTQGINPAQGYSYKLNNMPGKDFSGYHLLAYYYVSWKLAIPEMLADLKLPFDAEYQLAKQMFDGKP